MFELPRVVSPEPTEITFFADDSRVTDRSRPAFPAEKNMEVSCPNRIRKLPLY